MNAERGKFESGKPEGGEEEISAALESAIEQARSDPRFARLFRQDDEDEEALLAEARADLAAGRLIPHEKVVEWLNTWGTPQEGPPPREWFE